MRTRATPDPDVDGRLGAQRDQVLDVGRAQADWYTVFAKTGDPDLARAHDSITAFIVERELGRRVDVGRIDHKMGVRGVDTGELVLERRARAGPRT